MFQDKEKKVLVPWDKTNKQKNPGLHYLGLFPKVSEILIAFL